MGEQIGIMDYGKCKCPKCKSEKLRYGSYEPVDESFEQDVECEECGFEFELWADKPKYWDIYTKED